VSFNNRYFVIFGKPRFTSSRVRFFSAIELEKLATFLMLSLASKEEFESKKIYQQINIFINLLILPRCYMKFRTKL